MKKMGRPSLGLKLHRGDSVESLKAAYQKASSAVEQRRHQVIWQLALGKSREAVQALTGYSNVSIVKIINLYNEKGLRGLDDKRLESKGRPRLLNDEELLLLAQTVRKDYEQGINWEGAKLVTWLKEELGKEVHKQRAYEYLKAIGMSKQSPRPYHAKSDPIAQEGFKKNPS
jgi:transposase